MTADQQRAEVDALRVELARALGDFARDQGLVAIAQDTLRDLLRQCRYRLAPDVDRELIQQIDAQEVKP